MEKARNRGISLIERWGTMFRERMPARRLKIPVVVERVNARQQDGACFV
jgi:tRNA A37 threonylcarbamoyladenosine biosynthesis protein TsaE